MKILFVKMRYLTYLCLIETMPTAYLLIIAALGGLLALFAAAGWGSYNEKKIPATPILFRWFVAGVIGSGISAYAWVFGAGGDPAKLLESMSESLEVKSVVESLSSAVGGATQAVESVAQSTSEITVGMPSF
jgi:hypothetical protein